MTPDDDDVNALTERLVEAIAARVVARLKTDTPTPASAPPAESPDKLLTTREVAERLRLSVGHLEILRHKGGGPRYRKLGGRVLYRVADVQSWVDARARRNTSEKPAKGLR